MRLKQNRPLARAAVGEKFAGAGTSLSTTLSRFATVHNTQLCTYVPHAFGVSPRTCDHLMPLIEKAERLARTDANIPHRAKHQQLSNYLSAVVRFSVGRSYRNEAHSG